MVAGFDAHPVTGLLLSGNETLVLVLKGISPTGSPRLNQSILGSQLKMSLRFCSRETCETIFQSPVSRPLFGLRRITEGLRLHNPVLAGFTKLIVVVEEAILGPGALLFYHGVGETLVVPAAGLLALLRRDCDTQIVVCSLERFPPVKGPEEKEKVDAKTQPKPGRRYRQTPCFRSQVLRGPDCTSDLFLEGLRLSSQDCLHQAELAGRVRCTGCGKSGKFYCTRCLKPLLPDPGLLPRLTLPISVDIIKHERELDGKTTAFHAMILAPHQVTLIDFPFKDTSPLADYTHETTVVLFPGPGSVRLADLAGLERVTRVVVLDATWTSVSNILASNVLRGLRTVRLEPQEAHFWRLSRNPSHVSTIEAIWHFFRDYEAAVGRRADGAHPDDLLFFFAFFYLLVGSYMRDREGPNEKEEDEDARRAAHRIAGEGEGCSR